MKLRNLTFLLLAILVFAGPAQAQYSKATPATVALGADDSDVAMIVKYVGAAASGKVEVTVTSSDITFTEGAEGSEAANATFECPVSGALGGIIDVSNAACNTLGEICDVINGNTAGTATTATNWRCVIVDGLRSDVWDGRGLTRSATAASTENGVGLLWDTSTAFMASGCLNCPRTMGPYLARGSNVNPGLVTNPFAGRQAALILANATSTYGSGTSTLQVISSLVTNRVGATGSETNTTLYATPGGATTANKTLPEDIAPYGILGRPNEKLLFRVNNSAAASAVLLYGYGVSFPYQAQ